MKARITRYVNHIVAHRLERDWQGTTEVDLHLPMRPTVTTRYNGAVAIERGPLVYALRLGEEWTRVNADKPHRELPHADFEVRPTTPWNVGLVIDPARPDARLQFEERPVGAVPSHRMGRVSSRRRRRDACPTGSSSTVGQARSHRLMRRGPIRPGS